MSSPYSRRSWPSSERRSLLPASCLNVITATGDCIGSSPRKIAVKCRSVHEGTPRLLVFQVLRGVTERVRDRLEDVVHGSASRGHRTDRDQRDQRDEQRVLEQVLALFVAERLHDGNKLRHLIPPGCAPPWAVRWCGAAASLPMRGDLPRHGRA